MVDDDQGKAVGRGPVVGAGSKAQREIPDPDKDRVGVPGSDLRPDDGAARVRPKEVQ